MTTHILEMFGLLMQTLYVISLLLYFQSLNFRYVQKEPLNLYGLRLFSFSRNRGTTGSACCQLLDLFFWSRMEGSLREGLFQCFTKACEDLCFRYI